MQHTDLWQLPKHVTRFVGMSCQKRTGSYGKNTYTRGENSPETDQTENTHEYENEKGVNRDMEEKRDKTKLASTTNAGIPA